MSDEGFYVTMGVFLGIAFVLLFSLWFNLPLDGTEELGQAICDKEYDMDYSYYQFGILKCKDKEELIRYDGIKIKLNEVN